MARNLAPAVARVVYLACLAAASDASATVYCANNATELRAVFALAGSNGVADEIRVRNVSMAASGAMSDASTYLLNIADGKSVSISGGWADNLCSTQQQDARKTVLLPLGSRRIIEVAVQGTAKPTVTVSNLHLAAASNPSTNGCALITSGAHHLVLRNLQTTDVTCSGATITTQVNGGMIIVSNSLFAFNHGAAESVMRAFGSGDNAPSRVTITNNTFVSNVSVDSSYLVRIPMGLVGDKFIENNVIWNNQVKASANSDRYIENSGVYPAGRQRNNLVQELGYGFASAAGNISVDPRFVGAEDFRPGPGSPLINAGASAPDGGLAATDLHGRTRLQGGKVDIGAFEFEQPFFGSGFEPGEP